MDNLVNIFTISYASSNEDDPTLFVDLEYEDNKGFKRVPYAYRADSIQGNLPAQITQWIADNNPEILPYIPPPLLTPEDLRAQMPVLSPRQFRDALIDADIMPEHVTAAIGQIPGEKQRAKALNAWEYPTQFTRTDPLIDQIGVLFSLSPEQIDAMWPK